MGSADGNFGLVQSCGRVYIPVRNASRSIIQHIEKMRLVESLLSPPRTEERVQTAMLQMHENAAAVRVIESRRPLVIGHRGYSHLAPENTLAAFKLAIEAGADLVEMDYRHSKDGVPVVIHDPKLDRTTNAVRCWKRKRVRVASKTAAELRRLDAGRWFGPHYSGAKIPLLSEALDFVQTGSIALVEQKAGDARTCICLLREKGLINKIIIQSFNWEYLCRIHQHEPEQVLAALGPARILPSGKRPLGVVRKLNAAWLKQAAKTGARVIVWTQKLSKKAVHLAHERGLKVWVYTINKPKLARRLLAAGVDGIITNDPVLIRKEVADQESSQSQAPSPREAPSFKLRS